SNFGQMKDLLKHKIFTQKNKENKSNIELEGSIMIILATNAPLNERQLKPLANRAGIALGNSGNHIDHCSDDIVIAFSTEQTYSQHYSKVEEKHIQIREDHWVMDELIRCVAEAPEEAILKYLKKATTNVGRKGRIDDELNYNLI